MRTPAKTAQWEEAASWRLSRGWSGEPLRVPVRVVIEAVFPRPKSKAWKTKPMPRYPHTSRPDADNVAKAVCDSLEKAGVIHNDSQVHALTVHKWVASASEQPHVGVVVQWESDEGE
jgi:Holliday junction resolvase RusA-like endonuclease